MLPPPRRGGATAAVPTPTDFSASIQNGLEMFDGEDTPESLSNPIDDGLRLAQLKAYLLIIKSFSKKNYQKKVSSCKHIRCKLIFSCKLYKFQSESSDQHSRVLRRGVGAGICKSMNRSGRCKII